MLLKHSALPTFVLFVVSSVAAQLPYNPTKLFLSSDKTRVYQFSPQSSALTLSYFELSNQLAASSTPVTIDQNVPFQTTNRAFTPISDDGGITVLVGDCQDEDTVQLWRFTINKDGKNGTWNQLQLGSSETALAANYLSAGFSFSSDGALEDTSIYVFGGMCPTTQSNSTDWTSQATYSNTMLSVSSIGDQSPSTLSATGSRAPPIAEAGLSITPLSLVSIKSSAGQVSQQQNFVLLGGHTQNAFINMSQLALFSLPEASWSFVGVDQPVNTGELVRRDAVVVEPRSGHSAVLTEDGESIIIFGGWVGQVTNAAVPSLAVLRVGQGYGGTSSWQWTVPKQTSSPLIAGQSMYGHGAVMLPGNVMMVAGGTNIGSAARKRSVQKYMFYNVNTDTWSDTYKPSSSQPSGGLDLSQKAGIGAGLGLGLSAIAIILAVWWFYRRKLQEKRAARERYLRGLAFGSERHQSSSRVVSRGGSKHDQHQVRSASWGNRQEQQVENNGLEFPWSNHNQESQESEGAERTGTEVPSPTRGLRKSLSTRGPATYGNDLSAPVRGPGSVFRIDEVDEDGSIESLRSRNLAGSRMSDPFKDPPNLEPNTPAERRRREVQGWVEDWQEAANSISPSRDQSQVRTYSSLSQHPPSSDSSSYRTGRESPDKSDRTGSNLSERSAFSLQRSQGTLSRQLSHRSVSAGYTLFTSAAAAMSRLAGTSKEMTLERSASKRSVSLNTAPRRTASGARRPTDGGVTKALLQDMSPTKSVAEDGSIKNYKNYARSNSVLSQRRKPGILGSMKRVLTGTSQVDVQAQVEHYEEQVDEPSPTKIEPEMSETTSTPAFWRGQRGAKDWETDGDDTTLQPLSSNTHQRNSTMTSFEDYDGEEWDVETAVQKRVVQVMFTVPKEKLRVVNADALSLVSRSDVDEKDDRERTAELGRMDSVKESGDEDEKAKGKDKA